MAIAIIGWCYGPTSDIFAADFLTQAGPVYRYSILMIVSDALTCGSAARPTTQWATNDHRSYLLICIMISIADWLSTRTFCISLFAFYTLQFALCTLLSTSQILQILVSSNCLTCCDTLIGRTVYFDDLGDLGYLASKMTNDCATIVAVVAGVVCSCIWICIFTMGPPTSGASFQGRTASHLPSFGTIYLYWMSA